jgi:hypothetical protein
LGHVSELPCSAVIGDRGRRAVLRAGRVRRAGRAPWRPTAAFEMQHPISAMIGHRPAAQEA